LIAATAVARQTRQLVNFAALLEDIESTPTLP
jgi:hypothetical protein